jgi:signal transduction histidine kinase
MQAHPQSSPAARIISSSRPESPPAPNSAQPATVLVINAPSAAEPLASIADHAGLAHDAGNLLSALGLYCDLLSVPGVLRPEHGHYATELSLISNRSTELIRRLLARPVDRSNTFIPEQLDALSEATPVTLTSFSDYATALRNLAPVLQGIGAGVAKVSVVCAPSVPDLGFDVEIFERITVNLVRNAVAAIRDHRAAAHSVPVPFGQIRVSLAVITHRLQLTVEDNGPGMPPAAAAAFLQPVPLAPGALRGLGHRIVHELAAFTNGSLFVRVRPGNSTVFCLKWPLPGASTAVATPATSPSTAVKSVKEGSR